VSQGNSLHFLCLPFCFAQPSHCGVSPRGRCASAQLTVNVCDLSLTGNWGEGVFPRGELGILEGVLLDFTVPAN
jgi:hypothetical protein